MYASLPSLYKSLLVHFLSYISSPNYADLLTAYILSYFAMHKKAQT